MEGKERVVSWYENNEIERRSQPQVIRRIPGYQFFEPFKHSWRRCISHEKNITLQHVMDHLFEEPGNWQEKLKKVVECHQNIESIFQSKVQKTTRESMKKLAERLKHFISIQCEPYQRKRNNN